MGMNQSADEKRRLFRNAAANWAGFVSQLAVAFFLSPIIVRGLGDRSYGIWSQIESVLAYLMLFDLGIGAAVVRYVARFEACKDQTSLNRLFNTSFALFLAAGLAAGVLGALLAFFGLGPLGVPEDLLTEARWLLLVLAGNLALGFPMGTYAAVLDGLGRYPTKTGIRVGLRLVNCVLVVLVLRQQGGVVGVALAATATNIAEHILVALFAHLYLPALRLAPRFVDRQTLRLIQGYSWDAFVIMIANRICFQTDALVIGAFLLAPQYITFFAIGFRLVEYAKNSLREVLTVLTPTISALDARGNQEGIRNLFVDCSRYALWLILPVWFGLLFLGRPFLCLWLDEEHAANSYPTLVILSLPLALAMTQVVSTRILYGIGRLRWLAWAAVFQAVANLGLSVLLVKPWGIEGVAWGTTVPNAIYFVAVLFYVCRILGLSVGAYTRRALLTPLLVSIPLAVGWAVSVTWFPPASWAGFFATLVAGCAAYLPAAAVAELGWEVLVRAVCRAVAAPATRSDVAV
jgi:O-antigen/teichoic acid export membrane protein